MDDEERGPGVSAPERRREVTTAVLSGLVATGVLLGLVVFGSRNLQHFDAALFAYLFATLFAVFGIAYRYSMWLQRPPTAVYWRRSWRIFLRPRLLFANLVRLAGRSFRRFALNDFIWKRDWRRGLAHWLIMWGCILAAAITFPLVFGWIHFETVADGFERYRVVLFGFPTFSFPVHSVVGHLLFHGLVWSSFLVIGGVMLAFRRRMRSGDAAALQRFGEDILPLLMLFAISITGLLIWVSYQWMEGYAYSFLAVIHAVTVILTLLWLPFGKLFHLFQRPAQFGVAFYEDEGRRGEQAHCAECGDPFASKQHVDDLIEVERRLGYRYDYEDDAGAARHYQQVCPRCRRSTLALAQGSMWADQRRVELPWTTG